MKFKLDEAVRVLERTPGVLRAMLAGVGDGWVHGNYGEGTFSPFDVVGHLITGERTDWMARVRLILEHGTSRPFEKYDRYAQFEASRGRGLEELLREFAVLRGENLAALRGLGLSVEDLGRRGVHPALGEVTLGQVLATWVAHDLNHVGQVAKAMATQYEGEVGPWKAYLGILRSPVTRMEAEGAERKRASGG